MAVTLLLSLVILLLRSGFINCESSSLVSVMETVNGNVTFSLLNTQPFEEITWKKGRNKIVDWELNKDVKFYPHFKGRADLDIQSGDLHIFNLTSLDEGEYEVAMLNPSKSKKFNLKIFDHLPPPTLQCDLINDSIEVRCKVPESYSRHQELLNYSWRCSSGVSCAEFSGDSSGSVLNILKTADLSQSVHCFVANPVSNKTSSILLSTCVPGDNSRKRYGLIPTILIPVIAFILITLVMIRRRQNQSGTTS